MTNEQEVIKKLSNQDWFDSVSKDQFGRPVVYVKNMSKFILEQIPNNFLVHFANSKNVTADKYAFHYTSTNFTKSSNLLPSNLICSYHKQEVKVLPTLPIEDFWKFGDEEDDIEEQDLAEELDDKLFNLSKICNFNTLENIFFEIHDKNNAITNLSPKYPEVVKEMKKLYDQYGFDVLFDQFDDQD